MPNDLGSSSLLVLAEGDNAGAVSHARGHLFEVFVAKLLESYGYHQPTQSKVNVNSNGIELDIVTHTRLENRVAIVECKAYTQPVAAKELTNFYGKLNVERFKVPDALGLIVVVPSLTSDGQEFAKSIVDRDSNFRYMDSDDIAKALLSEGIISENPAPSGLDSDHTIVVTKYGTYAAVLDLDPDTRLPVTVCIWGSQGNVPAPVIELVSSSPFAQDLPVRDPRVVYGEQRVEDSPDSVVLATVVASKSDFQYQLPAGPKYFVGRKLVLETLAEYLYSNTKVVVLNAQSGWGKSSLALKFAQMVKDDGGNAVVMDTRTASSPRYVVEVLRKAVTESAAQGLVTLPVDASWASLSSTIFTIRNLVWGRTKGVCPDFS